MNNYSFKADEQLIDRILSQLDRKKLSAGKHPSIWQYRDDDVNINIYNTCSVVLSGRRAEDYYKLFFQPKKHILPQAGSDEVGTGDFFGPICVCASYVDEQISATLSDLNLTDSKQLTDVYIREIGERLIASVPHSLLVLDNQKYNSIIASHNMNAIKAMMHNQAYLNLQKKGIKLPDLCVVDDFCGEELYYRYLKDADEVFKGLTFHTKAESQFISVAIGSIISRYAFLRYMDSLSEKYLTVFPKGAGAPVEAFLPEFVSQFGIEELRKVAKCNFRNYKNLL